MAEAATQIECSPVELTNEQRANLAKLAAYLRTLPSNYPDFEMSDFTQDYTTYAHVSCGTAACAVGHGPAAGIDPIGSEEWTAYSRRAFTDDYYPDNGAWEWCFGGSWSETDNTVHGAAARIEFMLEHGIPGNGAYQRCGDAPLCYTVSQ